MNLSLDRMRTRGWSKIGTNFALCAFGVVVAVAIAEIVLRIAGISYPNFFSFWVPDPYCGAFHRPGASGLWTEEGRAYIRINSEGLRDVEHTVAKPPNTFRIAILGDSYAEAFQVPAADAFWAVMERELSRCPAMGGRRVEAINFGVSDFGTAQELQMLRHRVWKYSPDMVVLAVTPGNDIQNNSRKLQGDPARPYFVLDNGKLSYDGSFLDSPEYRRRLTLFNRVCGQLIAHSRVLQLIDRIFRSIRERARIDRKPAGAEPGLSDEVFKPPVTQAWVEAWNVTDRLIDEINAEVKGHGAILLVVTLTSGIQVNPDPAVRNAALKRIEADDLFYPGRRIKALGERGGFQVLNLGPPMLEYAEKHHACLHGFSNTTLGEGHWNEAGHKIAGKLIAEKICRMLSGRPQLDHGEK